MPTTPPAPCTTAWCPNLTTEGGRCADCRREQRRLYERNRPTAAQRGYSGKDWDSSRATTLQRDPTCTCTAACPDHGTYCPRPSTVADHHPHTRKQLLAQGVPDPDHPTRLRGICKPCHDRHTANTTPGGWHANRTT